MRILHSVDHFRQPNAEQTPSLDFSARPSRQKIDFFRGNLESYSLDLELYVIPKQSLTSLDIRSPLNVSCLDARIAPIALERVARKPHIF